MLSKIIITITMLSASVFTSLASSSALAGESGYIRHGKTVVVYKDGKKVGDWPKDDAADGKTASNDAKDGRQPASAAGVPNDTLYFSQDDAAANGTAHNVRCYAISNAIGFNKSEPVSCVLLQ